MELTSYLLELTTKRRQGKCVTGYVVKVQSPDQAFELV
jgi:hypothetical protein